MIRVQLPYQLRILAQVKQDVLLTVAVPVTLKSVLDVLEANYPVLRGTLRDQVTHERRPFIRFFACEEDISLGSPDCPLPEKVTSGVEALLVIGAIAGGTR